MKWLVLLFLTAACFGQSFYTHQEAEPWQICTKPLCNPGGVGVPSSVSDKFAGRFLELSLSGPAYTNALFVRKVGETTANYFIAEFDAYIPEETPQALEYDIFAFNQPTEYMFGSQCDFSKGFWEVWSGTDGWVETKKVCNLSKGWHHIQWFVHRSNSTLYYDMLIADEIAEQFEIAEPSNPLPKGWNNTSGIQFQLDIGPSAQSLTERFKNVSLIQLP